MSGNQMTPPVTISDGISIGSGRPLALIAGPCVIESREHCLKIAELAAAICRRLNIPYIFKASFDKANRTSVDSFRGPGLESGLATLAEVRKKIGVPILSDIHEITQAAPAGQVLDIIQIPAFLCRQTDLLFAASKTGKVVNVKKGQFMAPDQMRHAVKKVHSGGNDRILLTERGAFFGYGRLVNDMTAIDVMRGFAPVVFDATHSCQSPGAAGSQTGGERRYAPLLARAAVAAGADAIFLEIHDHPDKALSDAATVWPIDQLESLLRPCVQIRASLSDVT